MNLEAAEAALFIKVNGMRIAFLSFTSEEPFVGSVIAGPDRPGCASMFPPAKAVSRVHAVRNESDTLCVVLHWGHEHYGFPSPEQVLIARELIGAGADLVIGHHPHIVQGLETHKGGLIAYSLGNFFLPPVRMENGRIQTRKKSGREFAVLKISIEKGHPPGFQMLGGKVRLDYTLVPYTGPELIRFRDRIERLSSPIQAEGYDSCWKRYREKESELSRRVC
jgi:poly-gamma-glutamate synthesis protein (capsule biosynthesis protein)